MSSLTTSNPGRPPAPRPTALSSHAPLPGASADEVALYLATAAAIGASLLAAGWASGSAHIGALAAALACLGLWVSWRTQRWPARRRAALGAFGAVLCAGSLYALISWEIRSEIGNLYMSQGDVGLTLALRMSVFLVALSFLLVNREALPFALVPGVTLFGLAGGRGASPVAFGCFLVFLPAALTSLAQAMLLSGRQPTSREAERRAWTGRRDPASLEPVPAPSPHAERGRGGEVRLSTLDSRPFPPTPSGRAEPRPRLPESRISNLESRLSSVPWRTRHWSLLATLFALILALAALIYLPAYTYGDRYYWPLAMMTFPSARLGFLEQRRADDSPRTYSVGQGPIASGDTPMLSFTGPPAPLWRGEVFDTYTGSTWRSSDEQPLPLRTGPPPAPFAATGEDPRPRVGRRESSAPHRNPGPSRPHPTSTPSPRSPRASSRGATFSASGAEDNGREGRSSPRGRSPLSQQTPASRRLNLAPLFPPTAPGALVTNEIRVEHDMPLVIYSAGQIQQAAFSLRLATAVQGRIFADKFGCLTAPGVILPAGARYQVTSDPNAFAAARDSASEVRLSTLDSRPSAADEAYLRLPLSSRRVTDLARRLTAGARSTEDKLQALVSYLDRECIYTRAAPAIPTGQDAADFFLFTSRRGYCDLFATAFAVMARSIGVPSRFVTGYAGGQFDPDLGRYLLRESDAHAWVEVWVERPVEGGASSVKRDAGGAASLHSSPSTLDGGWVAVDPTPGGGPVTLSPFAQAIAAVRISFLSRPWAWPLLGALLLAAALAGLARLRRRRAGRVQFKLDRNDPRAIVLRAYARLTRALARRGLPRRPSQTPLEYVEEVERRSTVQGGDRSEKPRAPRSTLSRSTLHAARALTDLFLLARYSPHPITPETAALALSHLDQGIAALRRRPRPTP